MITQLEHDKVQARIPGYLSYFLSTTPFLYVNLYICLKLRAFPGHRTFGAKTGKVLNNQGPIVTFMVSRHFCLY